VHRTLIVDGLNNRLNVVLTFDCIIKTKEHRKPTPAISTARHYVGGEM